MIIERQSESQGNEGDAGNDNVDLIAFDNEQELTFLDGGKFPFYFTHFTIAYCPSYSIKFANHRYK